MKVNELLMPIDPFVHLGLKQHYRTRYNSALCKTLATHSTCNDARDVFLSAILLSDLCILQPPIDIDSGALLHVHHHKVLEVETENVD